MKSKSPFFVVQEFLSPLLCEDIVDSLNFTIHNADKNDIPIKTFKSDSVNELIIFQRLQQIVPTLEKWYNISYMGTESVSFEWFAEGCAGEEPHCENSVYLRKKWLRTRNRDLSCVLFMSDYQSAPPFDDDFEVYGGKLEFPQHGFGFNPQRGTLIIYPSCPHFLSATQEIFTGDLFQAKFHIATKGPFLYDPKAFPGDYRSWLQEFA